MRAKFEKISKLSKMKTNGLASKTYHGDTTKMLLFKNWQKVQRQRPKTNSHNGQKALKSWGQTRSDFQLKAKAMLTSAFPQIKHKKMIADKMDNYLAVESITFLEPMIIASPKYPMNSKMMTSKRQKSKRKRLWKSTTNSLMPVRCSLDMKLHNGLRFSGILNPQRLFGR